MQEEVVKEEKKRVFPFWKGYWSEAVRNFTNTKMLVFAALICALRIAVKALRIPVLPGELNISFDPYVNAIGSLVYGPLVGLAVGAVSDTIGAILFPSGAYFFPFIFVEMSSSFLFGLFLWKRKLTAPRVICAKFTVSFFCNIVLTSLVMKWNYQWLGLDKTYYFINLARIVKNLIMFPLEGILICFVLNAFLPALKQLRFATAEQCGLKPTKRDFFLVGGLLLLSVAIVLLYVFFLKDWLAAHNVKLW